MFVSIVVWSGKGSFVARMFVQIWVILTIFSICINFGLSFDVRMSTCTNVNIYFCILVLDITVVGNFVRFYQNGNMNVEIDMM